ncbi:hypothetical protein WA026_004933 [Henosepilachna vigintioctopunctata]|uniref:K Homology domain-containing protein n=1 Tax=Henosepilachna vigintioctopunctata TaxID=420089 RepID=A0AAW1UU03_9CUCU
MLIAAKINPGAGSTGEIRPKRPLEEGQESDAKKGPGNIVPPQQPQGPLGGPPMGGRPNPSLGQGNMGGPGPGMGGPTHNEDIKVPDKMVGLRMNNINQGMGGPGSHGPPGMGGPGGGRSFVEIMIPGPKVGLIIGKGGETIKQLQEKSGAKMVVIQDGPNQEQEKPLRISGDPQKVEFAKQLVYDLIAEKEMQNFRGGGRRNDDGNFDGGYGGPRGGGGGSGFEVLVPRAAVGVVIGKGGDMIKKIQAETGARVQFQQAREEGPGERSCFLQGNPKQVEQARMRIEELIESVQRRDTEGNGGGRRGGGGRGGVRDGFDNRGGNRNGSGGDYGGWEDRRNNQSQGSEVSFSVPANKCGVIIGRGGDTIKQINAQSGAHCELDRRNQNPNATEKIFIIRGDPDSIETAKRIIQDKIQMPLNFINSGGPPSMSNSMPTAYPGMAPQGYNPQGWGGIPTYPQQQTPQQPPSQQWGAPAPQASDQPTPPNPQMNSGSGQADYSLQWAEYYRSLGMHREAEMIEQQAKNKATGQPGAIGSTPTVSSVPAAVPAAAPAAAAANGQLDYSAQWADYYRSLGKLKEAEAIEAQMKNKVPTPVQSLGQAPTASGPAQAPAGSYTQQPYGAYQPTGGYYGAQPTQAVPGAVPQTGYGFPSYGYGGPSAGGPPGNQDN